jgi:NADPH:quinone reductase-like Zn-dependent oxidoreductase
MRAIAVPAAGAFDQLGLVDVPAPVAGAGQLLVRVVCAAVNAADLKVLRGEFAGRVLHARQKPLVAGYDFSGVVEEIGDGVTDIRPGEEVFGHVPYSSKNRQGTFAERVAVPRAEVGKKPAGVAHAVAAAAATAGLSGLQSVRDLGRLRTGGRVLVIGAAGGVGSVSIGIARALGATVDAVCSTYAVEFVRGLGATEVIDRKVTDPRTLAGPYDVIFDAAAGYSYGQMRRALAPAGGYVTTLPDAKWMGGKIMTAFSKRHCHFLIVKSLAADLEQIAAWIVAGTRIPIAQTFPVRDLAAALDKFTRGEVLGRIAIDVERGW